MGIRDPLRARELSRRLLESRTLRQRLAARVSAAAAEQRLATLRGWARSAEHGSARAAERSLRAWMQRHRPALLAAAAVLVALFAALPFLLKRSAEGERTVAEALREVLRRAAADQPLSREQDDLVASLLPTEARPLFTADPRSAAVWDELGKEFDVPRGAEEAGQRLIAPRAAIATRTPVFRFEVPKPDPKPDGLELHYVLTLSSSAGSEERYDVIQGSDSTDVLVHPLPEGRLLDVRRDYTWSVRLDPKRHPEYAQFYRPEAADFRVLDPAERMAVLGLPSTGDAILDRLVRAAAFLAKDLAQDALGELEGVPADASEEGQLGLLLRATAHAKLDERLDFDEQRKRVLLRERAGR